MFQKGELVIYGSEGVCEVVDISVMDLFNDSREREYYTLAPLYRQGKIYTPVDTTVFMRPIITKKEALMLIARIPEIHGEVYENRNIRILSEHYQESLQSHDCTSLVKTIKAIYKKRELMTDRGKKLGQVDEKFFKKAEDLLYGEFAAALDIPKTEVGAFIRKSVENPEETSAVI